MFEAWGRGLYRARRLTLVIGLLFAVGAAVWGTGVFGKLDSGNTFTPPNSQSNVESNLAASVFGRNDADVVVLFHSAATHGRRPGLPAGGHGRSSAALPAADVTHDHHVLVERAGQPRLRPTGTLLTPCCSSRARTMPPGRTPTKPSRMTWLAGRGTGSPPRSAAPCPPRSPSTARSPATSPAPRASRCPCLLILLVLIFGSVVAAALPSRSAAWRSSARSPCCGCSPSPPRSPSTR